MDQHEIENVEQNTFAPNGQGLWEATCSCRNPDGDGVGEVAFTGNTLVEVVSEWGDHLTEMVEQEIKNAPTNEQEK